MRFHEILSKIFGNKFQRDLKDVNLHVQKVLKICPFIENLSHDELRARSQELMFMLERKVAHDKNKVNELRNSVEMHELKDRRKVWDEIVEIEKNIIEKQEKMLDEILPEVFAIVKDTARRFSENETIEVTATDFDRWLAGFCDFIYIDGNKAFYKNQWFAGGNKITWSMIHYNVQLFGGVVLHNYSPKKYTGVVEDSKLSKKIKGYIAEMATGEGKTLVATLSAFLNAMTHNGVHIVTVNDYLSKRDSEWMGPLYMFHGLSVDCIDKYSPNSNGRRKAYEADITFGTNSEFGFDYLRDNMAIHVEDLVQRKLNYAIIDEVDSVLIDDARTPLIISGSVSKKNDQLYSIYCQRVENLVEVQKKLINQFLIEAKKLIKSKNSKEHERGLRLLFCSYKGMPKNKALIKYLSEPGIKAMMLKTEEFYMQQQNREMHVITNELYFVIDEKNKSVELTDKGIDVLTKKSDDSDFFILPDLGIKFAEIEFESISEQDKQTKKDKIIQNYAIKSERIHTINQLLKAYCLFEKNDEYVLMGNKVLIVDEQTGRIMDGRRYSDGLHQALEAKERVKVEFATQTFASITLQNYFRMYRKLAGMTGTAETEAGEFWDIYKLDVVVIPTNRPIIRMDRDDRLYKTANEKYTAIIQEIIASRERGCPVLVGTISVEISELISRMLSIRKIPHNVLNAKLHKKEADIISQAGQVGSVTIATNMAGRGTDIKLSEEVKKMGGLVIVGTERHESRRIDRQLRGRSGRQGDPGSSVFFISLEDDLMRLFAPERIVKIMDKMGFKKGEVLEARILNNAVERAQKKIEENNSGIRKRLLEYDDVMNSQREVIYRIRSHSLSGEQIELDILNMIYDVIFSIVEYCSESNDYSQLKIDLHRIFMLETIVLEEDFQKMKQIDLTEKIFVIAVENFKTKNEHMIQAIHPNIVHTYEDAKNKCQNIIISIADGNKMFSISCSLKSAYESGSMEIVRRFEKAILLHFIDEAWKEHLRDMDELRISVQNVTYENKDPLLIYKLESFRLFKKMLSSISKKIITTLFCGQVYVQNQLIQEIFNSKNRIEQKVVGRNESCPCRSGKKYKYCCGKL